MLATRPSDRPSSRSQSAGDEVEEDVEVSGAGGRAASDIDLIGAHLRGDGAAFACIMSRYESRIRGMCWRYVRDAAMLDDLVQETFCSLLLSLHRVDDGFNVAAWIHRIAVNLCLDELRRRSRRAERSAPGDVEPDLLLRGLVDHDSTGQPEGALERKHTGELVRAAIARVPERQRRILVLRDVEGRTYGDIAQELGMTTGAVQGVLHRARERFKSEYLALEGAHQAGTECAKVSFIVHSAGFRGLRQDRLRSVWRHLDRCTSCAGRLGAVATPAFSPVAQAA